jgi:GntR family transcriptional regulator, rspAB operon transcriptional repressor
MRKSQPKSNTVHAPNPGVGRINARTGEEGETGRVYRLLKEAILQCEFVPGDFLIEADVARQCKTSRTPIREACNRLSQEGWIAQIRYKGYRIPEISVREIAEIYEYRKVLECFTSGRAAESSSDEQLVALARTIEIERTTNASPEDLLRANEVFHLTLASLAGNQRIYDQLKSVIEHVHRLDVLGARRHSEWMSHEDILAALNARDAEQAGRAMAAHVDSSRNQMLRLFGGAL